MHNIKIVYAQQSFPDHQALDLETFVVYTLKFRMRLSIIYTVGSIISHMGIIEVEHQPALFTVSDCLSYGRKVSVSSEGSMICLEALPKTTVECLQPQIWTQDLPSIWKSFASHSACIYTMPCSWAKDFKTSINFHDFRLPPWSKCDLCSLGILHNVVCYRRFETTYRSHRSRN